MALEHTPGPGWLYQLEFSSNKQKIWFEKTSTKKKEGEERFIASVSEKSMSRSALDRA